MSNRYTVRDLIDELQNCDPEAEVRLAFQPLWPLQYHIGEVVEAGSEDNDEELEELRDELRDLERDRDESSEELRARILKMEKESEAAGKVVWIGEGGQLRDEPYLPGVAARLLGWGR